MMSNIIAKKLNRFKGQKGEQIAHHYLKQQGLILITSNYTTKQAEIDLIMRDKQVIAFIEVRTRATAQYGRAFESVTRPKQRRIIQAATAFLQQKKWSNSYLCRFDVIGIQLATNSTPHIDWIKNAFNAQY